MNQTKAYLTGTIVCTLLFCGTISFMIFGVNEREADRQDTKQAAAAAGCNYDRGRIICLKTTIETASEEE